MPADEGAELRDAYKVFLDGRTAGHGQRSVTGLERALLSASAAGVEAETETVAAAVRLLQGADDSGTARLEVRDQGMTHRRWFEVDVTGAVTWGER